MRPADSCTYSLTRLLRWLESLSVARCSSLWQRYVLLSLSSSLMKSSSFLRSPETQWRRPVLKLSAPLIHTLRLVPGVRRGFCFPLRIQQKPTLGLVSSLVSSWKKEPASSVICRTSSSLARFCSICSSESFSGATGRGLLQRKPRRWSARRSVSRLAEASRSLRSCKQMSLQLQRERSQPWEAGASSLRRRSTRSCASSESSGLGPRLRRSSKAVRPSRRKRPTTAYTVVREQKRTPEISLGERPSEASSTICILSLRLGFTSRFIIRISSLRSLGDGDTLHWRPSLWWLDGCGVFTMPQGTVA